MATTEYNDFNKIIYSLIPSEVKILDVGCSTGLLGKRVRAEKCPKKLVGIEINSVSAKKAKKYYDDVLVLDIEKITKLPFRRKTFDLIIMGDILEHLRNPEKVLKMVSGYLSDKGLLIISVPNVAFFVNRVYLLFGKFEYRDKGILDKSHLRFFTLSSVTKLVRNAGCQIMSTRGCISTRPILSFMDYFAKLFPTLFAYQLLLVATVKKHNI